MPDKQDPIDLNLGTKTGGDADYSGSSDNRTHPDNHNQSQFRGNDSNMIGWLTVISGILGLFTVSIFFVPLTLVCSVIAIFMGRGLWAFFGFVLALLGFLSSPTLLGIVGLAALAAYFGF
jgi:hypothetical protein